MSGDDLFGGDYSRERAIARTAWPATLQWHGGNPRGSRDDFDTRGGFFLPEDGIRNLGLDPQVPPDGATCETLRFGDKREAGWGFARAHLAILRLALGWEDRETRQRFPQREYRRRKEFDPASLDRLRGRLYVLTVVRELADIGATEPVLVTLRGTYSRALDGLVRERLGALAAQATKLRQRAGREGEVPHEAFWLPVLAAPLARVGAGANTSEVALPATTLPSQLPTDDAGFLALVRPLLVPPGHTTPGGEFDRIWERYRALWAEVAAFAAEPIAAAEEMPGVPAESEEPRAAPPDARDAALRAAALAYPQLAPDALPGVIERLLSRRDIAPDAATPADYTRLAEALRQKADGALTR